MMFYIIWGKEFLNLCSHYKAVILDDDINNPIYLEIINILEYIKKIQSIFVKALKRSDFSGTANRNSSFKKRVTSQLTMLTDRLEHPFFPVNCESEKEKIKFQIKFLKNVLENKRIVETLNYSKIIFGLDNKFHQYSKTEIIALDELLNFFNGLKSNTSRLVNSVMFYINSLSNPNFENFTIDYINSVDTISTYFFSNEITTYDKKSTRSIRFSRKKMLQESTISTILFETPIYSSKNVNNGVIEYYQLEAIKDIFGFKNIFDESKPEENEQTKYQELKSLAIFKKEMGLSKEDIETITYLISHYNSNQLEGNIPLI